MLPLHNKTITKDGFNFVKLVSKLYDEMHKSET